MIKDKKDKRRKEPVWCFVWELADIWEGEKGERATTGHDDTKGVYIGAFYSFVVQCAEVGGIVLSKSGDPGSTIVHILKERRQRKSES